MVNSRMDLISFSLYLGLVMVGWATIYAVDFAEAQQLPFLETLAGKQAVWIGISLTAFFLIQVVDWKFWRTFAYPIYGIALFLLLAVLLFGVEIKGARSWFSVAGFTFQPSEIAKFGTCLAIASYLSAYRVDLRVLRTQGIVVGLFAVPMLLILLQPDAGSALVFLSFFILLFREGLNPGYYIVGLLLALVFILSLKYSFEVTTLVLLLMGLFLQAYTLNDRRNLWAGGALALAVAGIYLAYQGFWTEVLLGGAAAVAAVCVVLWSKRQSRLVGLISFGTLMGVSLSYLSQYAFYHFLEPHQQDRINVWLRPEVCDPRGALYNVLQSKMAISSGGFFGKGFTQGTLTKLNYVPEQSTDFIFTTIGEEQGFIGSVLVIGLFLALLLQITVIAERQRSHFARIYGYGVAGILFVHFFINLGMTMGLMPIIGIPLPFISKGGSALLGFTVMIAVLLKFDSHRHLL